MPDVNDLTQKELSVLEKKVIRIYRKAQKDIRSEITKYFKQFEDEDAGKRAELDAGEITKEEYQQWRTRQMAAGVQYEELRNRIAKLYLNANKEAREVTNDSMLDIFAENCNYESYILDSAVNG